MGVPIDRTTGPSPPPQAAGLLWRCLLGATLHTPDRDLLRRSRLSAALAVFLASLAMAVGLARIANGVPALALPSLLHVLAAVGCISLLRRGNPTLAANLLAGAVILTMAGNNLATAGRLPGAFLGSSAVVILTMLLTGPRAGGLWTGVLAASLVGAAFIGLSGQAPLVLVPDSYREQQWYTVGIVICLMSGAAGLVYERLHARTLTELAEAKQAADQAAAAKGTFLATMSHEIRTPLNGVYGMAQLLAERKLDPEAQALAESLGGSARALLRVINGVLDLSKIEAGAMRLEQTDFAVEALCRETLGLFSFDREGQSLTPTLAFEGKRPCTVRGDATRLQQVLTNLVGNALKFTERGHVVLRVRAAEVATGTRTLHFSVEDTGIGIRADVRPHLFEAFRQADSSTTRRFGGTGLGLGISQHLVRLMGGEIEVTSEEGVGSTFSFALQLPVGQLDADASPQRGAAGCTAGGATGQLRGAVLVAEDNRVNRAIVARMLARLGLEPTMASDGVEALELARTRRFDCVLMDAMMPRMDGYACTRALRDLEGYATVPIIALTANAFDDDRQRCMDAGMDDFLSKPLERERLEATLGRWLGATTAA